MSITYTFNHLEQEYMKKQWYFLSFLGKKASQLGLARNSQILRTQLFRGFPMSNLCIFDQRIRICGYFLPEMPHNAQKSIFQFWSLKEKIENFDNFNLTNFFEFFVSQLQMILGKKFVKLKLMKIEENKNFDSSFQKTTFFGKMRQFQQKLSSDSESATQNT